MVAQDALRRGLEHGAIVDAEMHVVVHRMGVEPQVEGVSLEKVVVDQGNERIQHSGSGEDHRQSEGCISLSLIRH